MQPEACSIVPTEPPRDPEDGITEEITKALQVRTHDENIKTWKSLWALLFPDDTKIPSSGE